MQSRFKHSMCLVLASVVLVYTLPSCRLTPGANTPIPTALPTVPSLVMTTTGLPAGPTAAPTVPLTTATAGHTDVSSLTGCIVFSAGPPHDEDIYVMDAAGTYLQRLTNNPGSEFEPAWAPDGTRIVYRDSRRGNNRDDEIYVMNADGSRQTNLTHNPANDWGPTWSPDGSKIIFNSDRDAGLQHLYVMSADGSGVQRVGDSSGEYPAWAPDGAQIVFAHQEPSAAGNDPDFNIYVVNVDGSRATRLTDYAGQDDWAAWSPDGKKIAFVSTRDNKVEPGNLAPLPDIWVMNADGSGQVRLTHNGGQFPAWSPDGRYIIFNTIDGLSVMHPDGSNVMRLPLSGVSAPSFPDWVR
jgi:TolB protein